MMIRSTLLSAALALLVAAPALAEQANQPGMGQPGAQMPTTDQRAGMAGKTDINTATAAELARLPGLDAQVAEAIVQYRDKHGMIRDHDDLKNIRGIDDAKLERLKNQVVVGKLDINKASAEQLRWLPGVDAKMANNIVEYRQRSGRFTSVEDLGKVQGVTNEQVQKIKDIAYVGAAAGEGTTPGQMRDQGPMEPGSPDMNPPE